MKKSGYDVRPGDRIRLRTGVIVTVTRTSPVGLSLSGQPHLGVRIAYRYTVPTGQPFVGLMVAFGQDRVEVLSP